MPPPKPSAEEEAAFMKDLMSSLDDTFWNAVPSPNPSPVKPRPETRVQTPKRAAVRGQTTPCKHTKPHSPTPNLDADIAALLEGAEDWDLDMDSFVLTPKKEVAKAKAPEKHSDSRPKEKCTRCIVESVAEVEVGGRHQINLVVKLDPGEERRSVILFDDWAMTDARVGDTINVIGTFEPLTQSSSSITSSINITTKNNLLILHPDLLLTATALSNAPQCRRKPLLSSLVRSTSDMTPSLVWGNMLHNVMQSCLSSNRWDEAWIDEQIDEVLRSNLSDLVKINFSVEQATKEVKARAKGLQAFSQRYISDKPKATAILTNTRASRADTSLLAISSLLDVEEDIWSPTYGLKGKLDATVQAVLSEVQPPFKKPVISSGPKPFEIKTGRAVAGMEHRAQTMLYNLLASERYGVEVTSGLLYYTQSEEVVQVPVSRNELRGLIIARNEMAGYMARRHWKPKARGGHVQVEVEGEKSGDVEEAFLPPTIDDERTCKRCYTLDTCMLYRKAVENVVDTDSPIADAYELKTSHLTPAHTSFFKNWENLLSLEEQDLGRFRKEIWTMGAKERELKGRCFASMTIDTSFRPASKGPVSRDTKIHQFTYRFVRSTEGSSAGSLLNGFLNTGDAVTVSVEPHLLALARGFIVDLTPTEVVIGVDHDLSGDDIRTRLAAFEPVTSATRIAVVFRIDKDELYGGMGRVRENLAQLFYADGDATRRRLVVDLESPKFDNIESDSETSDMGIPPSVAHHLKHLNLNQREAAKKVLSAQDYALILGMPGTGKTTVIAAIIKALVAMGKTVLLTSYTHSAVDTILMKIKDEADFGILRVGNVDKVHPDVQKLTLSAKRAPTTVAQLEQQIMTPPVVATTCLSLDHALFSRRKFDYCIVDEASQITLPTCLGPLRFADKFVLVGDHFQLPPLVRNGDARKGGLDVSLFRRLSDAHPHAVVDLAYQYRMNSDIMMLSNKLIYGDRLRCGTDVIANQSLKLPDRTFLADLHQGKACHSSGCWLDDLMAESCKAVFVDTDLVPAQDSRIGDLVQNEVEANLVRQVTETLLRSGVRPEQIGIISLYRQQIKLLTQMLHPREGIEILTADRSQGRDKDCVIISMVRSNDAGTVGDLVKDWRRMNVSFTRARSKLIIFGSRKTLQAAPLLKEFFTLMESENWILQLPAKADVSHASAFDPGSPSKKRVAEDVIVPSKENLVVRPQKKLKVKKMNGEEGLLRGRPILKDLMNEER